MRKIRISFIFLSLFLFSMWLRAQDVSGAIQNAVDDVVEIAAAIGAVVMGIVGVVGLGRAAWSFANGDRDAVQALVMGIVALFIGALCATFL